MARGVSHLVAVMMLLAFATGVAHAQTSSLSGVVTDPAGGVVPGATVNIVNDATKETHEAVTNAQGQFSFPALPIGTYTVTVSLTGFKTFIANNVRLLTGTAGTVNATLEVGALTEKVEVKSRSELVQSQAATVQTTLTGEQIREIPMASRNSLYAVTLLPGIQYGSGGGPRASGINGLPNNTINITIDGVQTGNMLQSTDGFFSMVTPRMDAVEEITVTGAVAGAGSGAGSVQIQFTTRSGSNQFEGSGYHYWRQPEFNSNYFFNKVNGLGRNEVIVHQYGFRQGGPIVIPGLIDARNKAFFFFNFEHLYQPSSATRTRTLLRPEAQAGIFGWVVTGAGGVQERRTADLMALARANGQIASFDPIVASLLNEIRAAANSTGTINDTGSGNTLQYVFQSEAVGNQYSPTSRVDINLSDNHRLSGAYWWQRFKSNPDLLNNVDPTFPGLPNHGQQNSYRTTGNATLRSTLGRNLVNEVKGGWQWSPNDFFANVTADHFENQGGYNIGFPITTGNNTLATGATATASPQPRNTTTWSVDNTLNWLRGAHSLSMGGGYAGVFNRQNSYTVAPTMTTGLDTNLDPARGMFANNALFPGATANQLAEARALYALLTGRVTSIGANARLDSATGKYVYNGDLARKSEQSSFNAFIQDQWRVKPTLTVNAGLRWDLYLPFTTADNTWSLATIEDICGMSGLGNGIGGRACNIFNPNATGGQLVPTFDLFEPGTPSHKTNWTDFAPNVGVAWRPDVQDGWMHTLLGDPEQATVRAGYSLTYNQERIDRFTANSGSNAGGVISATRNNTTGYPLVLPGESHPVLLSQTSRLGPPAFPEAPAYPLAAQVGDSINIFPQDRHLRTPRVHSYSAGVQRSIGRDMALEVRYVGNKNKYRWTEENWNERNIVENGFLDEFRAAQRNLQINVANGVNSFAYRGLPGQSPLPIHLAYLNGSRDVNNPTAYSNSNFTSSTFYNRFSPLNPNPTGAIGALDTTAFRANALAAGFTENFIVMNPRALGGTFVLTDQDWTKYDSLQVELRRRLSQGLLVSANYTYGVKKTSNLPTLRYPRIELDASDDRMAPHVFKTNWHWELPVGRGRRFGSDFNAVMNGVLGGWEFSGSGQVKRDRYRLANVVLEGMSVSELQKEFSIRQEIGASGRTVVFSFPEDIRMNTWAAFSIDPTTATGYSVARGVPTGRYIRPAGTVGDCMYIYRNDCGVKDINLNGPLWSRWDMRLKKRFPIHGRINVEVMAEVLNVFDTINFNHSVNSNPNNGEDTFRVTSAYTDINTTFDPGGRIGQLVWRINW
jgi:hypothetical protein